MACPVNRTFIDVNTSFPGVLFSLRLWRSNKVSCEKMIMQRRAVVGLSKSSITRDKADRIHSITTPDSMQVDDQSAQPCKYNRVQRDDDRCANTTQKTDCGTQMCLWMNR